MMDAERSSLWNLVVNFLLEENYLLTAFELLQELLEDGRDAQAIRLKDFFSDPSQFPPDQIAHFNSLRVADPQTLMEEKEALKEKLAISEYELRLAQEDITKLKMDLQNRPDALANAPDETKSEESSDNRPQIQRQKEERSYSGLGPLKSTERRDLNFAVKEYLLLAGYRLTAMTFYEEVTDQDLDTWQETAACVPDALRHYYYQYLSSTSEAAEEKIAMIQEIESSQKEIERLQTAKDQLVKSKELADGQVNALTKSVEALQKDLKDKEKQVQNLKQSLEHQRKELNDCRAEITSLKMHFEKSFSGRNLTTGADQVQFQSTETNNEEMANSRAGLEDLVINKPRGPHFHDSENPEDFTQKQWHLVGNQEETSISYHANVADPINNEHLKISDAEISDEVMKQPSEVSKQALASPSTMKKYNEAKLEDQILAPKSENASSEVDSEKMGLGTIQILADALPKIVPYVLINHREELLPLMMCAIERHPESNTRDSLTHTLFNLIKRPDEQQRRIIMDACVNLAKNVGEMRTETELLPQCWEQINHNYEERRLLVAQSCWELAHFVRPEIRDSLILSIMQQLIEDSATVVREAAARNLALLLPLFPNVDKYFKLVCDPSGLVVEAALKELLPAVLKWGKKLDHILKNLLYHLLSSAQQCPPLSGVEGSVESHVRVLGERERWTIDVLLRMLMELLPFVHRKAIETCPFASASCLEETKLTVNCLELYAGGHVEWPEFEWMHVDCFMDLIQLACLLHQKEDQIRIQITKFLLVVSDSFGEPYLTHIMLPVFLATIGDDADMTFLPSAIHPRIKGLIPRSAMAERLATMCVLPLLLAGVLGAPSKNEDLKSYLRKLLVDDKAKGNQSSKHASEIVDAVRFLCTFESHHNMIFNILWEMVVSFNAELKISAAKLLKVVVPYIDVKMASTHVMPALVTLGSDQNLNVKYASIDAFGAVAQHFKNDAIIDKIRVQMDAFLEDGSHQATIAVIRALLVAVPHTTDRLRDYLLSKIFQLSANHSATADIMRRRERADVLCESIRALDATDVSATSVRDFLIPTIQNLMKDPDALDPAHKEALEIVLKDRSGGTFETISKVMGAHLGLASSMTSFFGEGGLLSKKEIGDVPAVESAESPRMVAPPQAEDTRFKRIMRGGFTDMLRGKAKSQEETHQNQ